MQLHQHQTGSTASNWL